MSRERWKNEAIQGNKSSVEKAEREREESLTSKRSAPVRRLTILPKHSSTGWRLAAARKRP